MAQWLEAKVSGRTDWSSHLFSLRFECPNFPAYQAGQFTKVGLELNGKLISRPYSLVSHPEESSLEILALPVEEGTLFPKLHQLKTGEYCEDNVSCNRLFGAQ